MRQNVLTSTSCTQRIRRHRETNMSYNKTMHPWAKTQNILLNVLRKIVILKKVLYGTRHPMKQKDYMDSVDPNQPRHL